MSRLPHGQRYVWSFSRTSECSLERVPQVTEAVHAQGSFIFVQLWALGRAALSPVLQKEGHFEVVGASPIPLDQEHAVPRSLTVEEIKEYVQWYAQAAKNAMRAGFDGMLFACRIAPVSHPPATL